VTQPSAKNSASASSTLHRIIRLHGCGCFPGGSPSSSTNQNPGNICYNNTGSYDVTLITTSASGNDTLIMPDYVTVFWHAPRFPPSHKMDMFSLQAMPAVYQWQFNSVDIPGATNQSYNVLQTGLYTVEVFDEHGL